MNKILLIHGPNLNRLGKRNPEHYGHLTLGQIEHFTRKALEKKSATLSDKLKSIELKTFQSNHEGELIDFIQEHTHTPHNEDQTLGIIINPGAYSHTSFAIHDAILDAQIPTIEVHLSDIKKREEWRQISVTGAAASQIISGKKEQGYVEAVDELLKLI
jgi:3-dehydroquinate dehydratase-2